MCPCSVCSMSVLSQAFFAWKQHAARTAFNDDTVIIGFRQRWWHMAHDEGLLVDVMLCEWIEATFSMDVANRLVYGDRDDVPCCLWPRTPDSFD